MSLQGELYYQIAVEAFEDEKYEYAMEAFIAAYNQGAYCEDIIKDLYACFVVPNEQEFAENYERNCNGKAIIPYEELVLDFLPVSDFKYYVYDKQKHVFYGCVDIGALLRCSFLDSHVNTMAVEVWNPQDWMKCRSRHGKMFFVVDEVKAYFYSFYKLSGFVSTFMRDAVVFQNYAELDQYFRVHDEIYLPRKIVSRDADKYVPWLHKIHEWRIGTNRSDRVQPLLSICIPSWNRGSIALRAVETILQSEYDSEIEIIVSNNGSTENVEGYRQIEDMGDSRVRYFAFEENKGYAENVCRVLEMVKGKWAVLSSDEDTMVLDGLPSFLEYLNSCQNVGVCFAGGKGQNFMPIKAYSPATKYDMMLAALNCNYITGTVFNMHILQSEQGLALIRNCLDNLFVSYYTHVCLACIAANNHRVEYSGILLWSSDVDDSENIHQPDEVEVLAYATLESRIEQQNMAVEFIKDILHPEKDMFSDLVQERMIKTYYLQQLVYADYYSQTRTWRAICLEIHRNNVALINKIFQEDRLLEWSLVLEEMLLDWLDNHPLYDEMPVQEKIQLDIVNKLAELWISQGRDILEFDFEQAEKYIKEYCWS